MRCRTVLLFTALVAACQPLSAGQICARPDGAIVTKGKCSAQETRLSMSNIVRLSAPPVQDVGGLDIAQCRTIKNMAAVSNGVAWSGVHCDGGEFLLNYGYSTEPAALQVPRSSQLGYDTDGAPNAVAVTVQEDPYIQAETGSQQAFFLNVSGTCCPKT